VSERRHKWLRYLAIAAALVGVGVCIAIVTVDRWFFTLANPGTFDPDAVPPAPDYSQASAWAALPERDDGADVALPELPAIDQTDPAVARAEVFYIHPTSWLGNTWNAPIDDPEVIDLTERGGTLIQASAFNGCCAIHAPRYRQVHGRAFVRPNADGDAALAVAFTDIDAAFTAFLAKIGDRPFIVAGHSQGAVLGARLVQQRIADTALERRLVVAYLIGGPLAPEDVGLPVCTTAEQVGCVVGYNARGPDYEPGGFELADAPHTLADRICVNPLTWTTDETHAPASAHAGTILFDTPAPELIPHFADAQCRGGLLVITTMGELQRDLASKVLLWLMGPGNYHPVEYQLYYVDLRQNAADRVEAWSAAQG